MNIFGIAGWSGSGKTTLLIRLVPALVRLGLEVATIKHTHHNPAVGDDESRALAAAGAHQVLAALPRRFALMREFAPAPEPSLTEFAALVGGVDLLLVEGFKFAGHDKIEVWDPALGKPMLAPDHPSVVAVATDAEIGDLGGLGCPTFRRDDINGIARFIFSRYN
ncbi:MAG TPA: molybdopterin-guanine dinucleotide biosynthesis protein B [Magnetospirillum sp.]|nr:molybdopterin-guanine dinucleotide biosynthesis protein B [Magnetospirillum sp.]